MKATKLSLKMRYSTVLLAPILLSLSVSAQVSKPEWTKLVPLKSTRSEVEKVLGKPEQTVDSYALYENANGRFSVWYSLGGCGHKIEGRQWNVPRGLMTSLQVYVHDSRPLSSYLSNVADFRRTEMPYGRVLYVSSDESLIFETIKPSDRDEFVYSISLDPKQEQDKLRCK